MTTTTSELETRARAIEQVLGPNTSFPPDAAEYLAETIVVLCGEVDRLKERLENDGD